MDLNTKIENIEKEMKVINEKLDKILALLETDCKKMSSHIDFIEEVYDNIKHPLNFVMNKVSYLISDNKAIEAIQSDSEGCKRLNSVKEFENTGIDRIQNG